MRNRHKLENSVCIARKQVDIVIPVFGRFEMLERCLRAIPDACGDIPYAIYLIDNASPDKEKAMQFYQGDFFRSTSFCSLRRLPQNNGFPRACNLGAKSGKSEFILFLNSDVFLQPKAIQIMVEDLKADASIGVVGPKLLFAEGTPHGEYGKVQHAGLAFNIRGEPIHQFIGWNGDHPKVNKREFVPMVTGACLLTRRNLFEQAGGFFEGYGIGTWEDIDYCLTINAMGYTILYEPQAVGYHWVGASAVENNVQYPLNENQVIFLLRWKGRFSWSDWIRW